MESEAVQSSEMQYIAKQCNAMQSKGSNAMQRKVMQCNAKQCNIM
jgi:hypothetical protein